MADSSERTVDVVCIDSPCYRLAAIFKELIEADERNSGSLYSQIKEEP